MTEAPHDSTAAPPRPVRGSVLDAVRPTEGRLVGGVCEGVGRQLGIDPLILRVLVAVLTLVGFAGLIAYAAAWLVLPDQESGRSIAQDHLRVPDQRATQVRTVVLVVGGTLAALSIAGLAASGPWGTPLPYLGIVVVGVVVWWVFAPRGRGTDRPAAPAPPAATPPAATLPAAIGPVPPPPPAAPPRPPRPIRPPRPPNPRHDGGRLTGTFLLLSLVAAGVVGVWSVTVDPLPWGAYPAAVLATLGVGMLLGTVVGNARTLTFPAFVATAALAAMTVVPSPTVGDRLEDPTSAAAVEPASTLGMGRFVLDLTDVRDPAGLAGRTVRIENGLGEVRVLLPPDLPVEVDAYTRAGELDVLDRTQRGNLVRLTTPEPTDPHLRVVITQWAGRVVVDRATDPVTSPATAPEGTNP